MGSVCTGAWGWWCYAAKHTADSAMHFPAWGDMRMSPWWRPEGCFWKTHERMPKVISALAIPEEENGPERAKHKGVLTFTHKYIFYVVCEDGDSDGEVTESLPRKMAILKQSWPVQRKCTTTERTIFQLENLDTSLFLFFFVFLLNPISKYKTMLIVAPCGYYAYGALSRMAARVGGLFATPTFVSKVDFPVFFLCWHFLLEYRLMEQTSTLKSQEFQTSGWMLG